MKIEDVHPLDVGIAQFKTIQTFLSTKISLINSWNDENINFCAGVDIAYWEDNEVVYGVCCIVVIDYETKMIVEKVSSVGKITVPYIPGYLAFRELPLIIKTAKKLIQTPDLFMFDGNGYLHPRNMGIATHASFFLNKPTIGVAKSYFKMHDIDFKLPTNKVGSYTNIIVENEILGRVLRTRKDVKPIFISSGNDIDLHTTTDITLSLLNDESRLPIPVRLADLETKKMRRNLLLGN